MICDDDEAGKISKMVYVKHFSYKLVNDFKMVYFMVYIYLHKNIL